MGNLCSWHQGLLLRHRPREALHTEAQKSVGSAHHYKDSNTAVMRLSGSSTVIGSTLWQPPCRHHNSSCDGLCKPGGGGALRTMRATVTDSGRPETMASTLRGSANRRTPEECPRLTPQTATGPASPDATELRK